MWNVRVFRVFSITDEVQYFGKFVWIVLRIITSIITCTVPRIFFYDLLPFSENVLIESLDVLMGTNLLVLIYI